jgi:hypothetical protein
MKLGPWFADLTWVRVCFCCCRRSRRVRRRESHSTLVDVDEKKGVDIGLPVMYSTTNAQVDNYWKV